MRRGFEDETYPDGLVETAADNVQFVELQACDRPCVPKERTMRLARAHYVRSRLLYESPRRMKHQLTVPHPHRSVTTPTHESVAPELYGSDEILVQLPRAVSIWWRWHCESSCGGRGTGEQMGGKSIAGRRGRWMRYCPKDIHGHDALPGSEVPLSHSLV